MADKPKKKMHPLGCLALFVVVAAVVLGIGMLLGNHDDDKKTPCERYASTVAEALDNCHSGVNRSHRFHIGICEADIDPSSACLDKVRSLSCADLERGPATTAGEVCEKKAERSEQGGAVTSP